MTPTEWRKVRLVPGQEGTSVRMFMTRLEIGQAAKNFLGLPLVTENLPEETALEVGELFEQAFRKVEEAATGRKRKS